MTVHGCLCLEAGAGERGLGQLLPGSSAEGEGFERGCLQAAAVGLYPAGGLISGHRSHGN